jgi:short-subunit dehydrogenase
MELKNKVVVITGGSKGLGKALANSFIREGSIVIISSHNEIELKRTAKKINAIAIMADVTKENKVKNLAEKVVADFGKIDIWINNAGVRIPQTSIEKINMKRFHEMMDINLFGVVFGSKYALSQMKKQKEGIIMTTLSTAALEGKKDSSAYCASKSAALGFIKCLKLETDNYIKIINIYPGGMQTNFFDEDKPYDYNQFMDPNSVAEKIIENLKKNDPEEELVIRRNV